MNKYEVRLRDGSNIEMEAEIMKVNENGVSFYLILNNRCTLIATMQQYVFALQTDPENKPG